MSEHTHPISDLMDSSMRNLRALVDANTIIGEPITTPDGAVIIPVSKVSFGFASGGSDIPSSKPSSLFGGGSGSGVTMQPLGFLVVSGGKVELLQLDNSRNAADRVVSMIPEVMDKISALFNPSDKKEPASPVPSEEFHLD